ncbi:MAG: MBL fold metallo-hydrolase, partial [Sandaracinaceae bacterium]|nr:MBL fold metallo-hydrolase [Sandaracinaceae bacterium]
MLKVRFWGVRGSIPTPGPSTVEFGGNTSCVEVEAGGNRIIFDAGTGVRLLGKKLAACMPCEIHLFFSHVHWDHIQGFPFFIPAFVRGNLIHMYGMKSTVGTLEASLSGQMEFPNFPVRLRELPAELRFRNLGEGEIVELPGGVRISNTAGNHPGGVLCYRVDHEGHSVVYATDTEHLGPEPDPKLVALCQGADVVIYDSMYTPEEYEGQKGPPKIGWGHSHFLAGAALLKASGAKFYVLFHHDPDQDDQAVREKERRAR